MDPGSLKVAPGSYKIPVNFFSKVAPGFQPVIFPLAAIFKNGGPNPGPAHANLCLISPTTILIGPFQLTA